MTAWQTLASTAVDADSKGDTDLWDALVARDLHLREFSTGSTPRYNDRTPHDHSGVGGDSVIHAVTSPNLLLNCCPDGDDEKWSGSGVVKDGTTHACTFGASTSDYFYQILLRDEDGTGDTNHAVFGSGCPMVISFFAKAGGTDSAGTLYFGIADGSTTTFTTGHRFTLSYTDLSSSNWRRYYAYADATSNSPPSGTSYPGDSHSTDVRLLLDVNAAFTNDFLVTGFQVCAGTELTPFNWAPNEHSCEGYGRAHGEDRQPKAPIWSTSVAMTNAVEITTRA